MSSPIILESSIERFSQTILTTSMRMMMPGREFREQMDELRQEMEQLKDQIRELREELRDSRGGSRGSRSGS